MTLIKTLIFSVSVHICFAALLFIPAVFSDRNGLIYGDEHGTHSEKVFFVKLAADTGTRDSLVSNFRENESRPGNNQPIIEKKKTGREKSLQVKVQKAIAPEARNITVPVDTVGKQDFLSHRAEADEAGKLNEQEETADNVLPVNYETAGDEVIDISYAQGTAAGVSSGPVSHEGKGGPEKNKEGRLFSVEVFDLIRGSIERVKTYPFLARKMGIEGAVHISFRINPDGEPQNLKILKSSGSDILDTATMDIVKKAAPFPYVESIIEVPIVFRLN